MLRFNSFNHVLLIFLLVLFVLCSEEDFPFVLKMGAGQIGGIASLMDLDFQNAAGFIGTRADATEAQYVVHFLSHVMVFCTGSLIEAHVVLTAAACIYGERYKFDVFGGTHSFIENSGVSRSAAHICIHRGYNHTIRWEGCSPDNLGLVLLEKQYLLNEREEGSEFMVGRIRYGFINKQAPKSLMDCKFYGWGSRRNGYLVPLLLYLRRVDVQIMPKDDCQQIWNYGDKYLCLQQKPCASSAHGALCPDDLGSALNCGGFLRGMMSTRLIDRPCGIGFTDMSKYYKFLTCGVDDARDILGHNDVMEFEFDQPTTPSATTPKLITAPIISTETAAVSNPPIDEDIIQELNVAVNTSGVKDKTRVRYHQKEFAEDETF